MSTPLCINYSISHLVLMSMTNSNVQVDDDADDSLTRPTGRFSSRTSRGKLGIGNTAVWYTFLPSLDVRRAVICCDRWFKCFCFRQTMKPSYSASSRMVISCADMRFETIVVGVSDVGLASATSLSARTPSLASVPAQTGSDGEISNMMLGLMCVTDSHGPLEHMSVSTLQGVRALALGSRARGFVHGWRAGAPRVHVVACTVGNSGAYGTSRVSIDSSALEDGVGEVAMLGLRPVGVPELVVELHVRIKLQEVESCERLKRSPPFEKVGCMRSVTREGLKRPTWSILS